MREFDVVVLLVFFVVVLVWGSLYGIAAAHEASRAVWVPDEWGRADDETTARRLIEEALG